MNITIRSNPASGTPPRSTVSLEGALTIYEVAEAKPALLDALRQSVRVEVDLAGVCEIDTAGAQLLVMARREALGDSRELVISAHSEATRDAFDILNLAPHFE